MLQRIRSGECARKCFFSRELSPCCSGVTEDAEIKREHDKHGHVGKLLSSSKAGGLHETCERMNRLSLWENSTPSTSVPPPEIQKENEGSMLPECEIALHMVFVINTHGIRTNVKLTT